MGDWLLDLYIYAGLAWLILLGSVIMVGIGEWHA